MCFLAQESVHSVCLSSTFHDLPFEFFSLLLDLLLQHLLLTWGLPKKRMKVSEMKTMTDFRKLETVKFLDPHNSFCWFSILLSFQLTNIFLKKLTYSPVLFFFVIYFNFRKLHTFSNFVLENWLDSKAFLKKVKNGNSDSTRLVYKKNK